MVNLLWAPLYVIELALVEDRYTRLRRPIVVWWIVWIVSNAISMFAFATSWVTDAQGIANNTTMMVLAYLCAAAAVALLRGSSRGSSKSRSNAQRIAGWW